MNKTKTIRIIGTVLFVILGIFSIYVTFSNPELTQTQLTIKYWWLIIPAPFAAYMIWYKR